MMTPMPVVPALSVKNIPKGLYVLLVILLALLLTYLVFIPKPSLPINTGFKVGDIAGEDIIIDSDITIEDIYATNSEKQKAISNALPVYEFHQEQTEHSVKLISNWYEIINNHRSQRDMNESLRSAALRQTLMERFSITLSSNDLRLIMRSPSFQKLELNDLLTRYLELARFGILASKVSSRSNPQNRIQIQYTDQKRTAVSIGEVRDLKETRDNLTAFLLSKSFSTAEATLLASHIMEFVGSNLTYSESLSQAEQQVVLSRINPVLIKLKAGKVLVRRGDEFDPDDIRLLSLINANESQSRTLIPRQLVILFAILTLLFLMHTLFGNWNTPSKNHPKAFIVFSTTLLFSTVVYRLTMFLAPLILENTPFQMEYTTETLLYAVPFGLGALIIAFVFSFSHAIAFAFINAFLGGMLSNWDLTLCLYILSGNLAAIMGVETFLRLKRSTIFKSALLMVVPVQILAATLLSVEKGDLTFTFFLTNSSLALTSAMLSAILASFFIPLLETGFKLITELKLIELTNLNLPVFRQMLEKAPGTYHHSQMVASLAESAALDLKISPLMLTAMALYHDIGKIDSPQYFTENHSVYASPHSNMTPLESARAIIAHVSRGVELAVKLKLPPEVASVITQHHGSKIVKYFYDKALEKRTNGDKSEIDASDFRYPGKKPQTIENAIIMLADQVEAASKSLSRPTDNEIRNVIDMVIAANIEDNQFIECQGLTFQTLGIISGSFYKKLSSIYHMRIAYPGFDFSSERTQTDGQAAD
jgi:putative nucleotidyltransferase with HDIG domain